MINTSRVCICVHFIFNLMAVTYQRSRNASSTAHSAVPFSQWSSFRLRYDAKLDRKQFNMTFNGPFYCPRLRNSNKLENKQKTRTLRRDTVKNKCIPRKGTGPAGIMPDLQYKFRMLRWNKNTDEIKQHQEVRVSSKSGN